MAILSRQFQFPAITRATLARFSIYSSQPKIDVTFPHGVFCLAGANGLGKSTFLLAINYALTGIIPEPGRSFTSVDEYYSYCKTFSSEFFSGRINDLDRDAAETSLELKLGDKHYSITRGMFEPEFLRSFTIKTNSGAKQLVLLDTADLSPSERNKLYMENLSKDIGIKSFVQFVFLQHFVFTFDERRHLLFWDNKVAENAMYLAFGINSEEALRAEVLRREAEKADSNARNYNWDATQLRRKLEDLEEAVAGAEKDKPKDLDLKAKHQDLTLRLEEAERKLETLDAKINDINVKIAEHSAQQVILKTEYEKEYSARLQSRYEIRRHPVIAVSLAQEKCEICGAHGDNAIKTIKAKTKENNCPLCGTQIKPVAGKQNIELLKELDGKLRTCKHSLEEAILQQKRLTSERSAAFKRYETDRSTLAAFEKENIRKLQKLALKLDENDGVYSRIQGYRDQIDDLLEKKNEQYAKRDQKRSELLQLQKGLLKSYSEAEERFVPGFKDLAHSFLGLDIDMRLESAAKPGISILLEITGSARREMHQLSESQRFFIDIALRMALLEQMCAPENGGCLLIDTPEGSLDIAYEKRAGDMFFKFIKKGFSLVMTSNINTSKLLLSLAEQCGIQKMTLCRMTSWTDLSEVQIKEDKLFQQAYHGIEAALKKGAKD